MPEEQDDNIYKKETVEEQLEDDEVTSEEAGFMEGYSDNKAIVKCASCGNLLDLDKLIEEETDGQTYRFCSTNCAESFEKKQEKKE